MIGRTQSSTNAIASVYAETNRALTDALTRIASGKKFRNASEDLLGFIRSRNLTVDIKGYERVRENLTEFKSYSTAAVEAASSIYQSLTSMKDLAKQYAGTSDTDLQAEYRADFNAFKKQVTTALENTYVDGVKLTSSGSDVKSVDLDPDGTGTLTMNFTAIASNSAVKAIDITDTANAQSALQSEISSMLTYLSEAKAYDSIATQQLSHTETIIASKQAVVSLITDIDDAQETSKVVDLSVRLQAGVAMLAQGNIVQNALLKLYE